MMKMKLDAANLRVESFVADDRRLDANGTVHANEAPPLTFRNCPATSGPTCQTNCDCTLGCPSIAPCTIQIG
jgi:hypothetical protein